MLLGFWSQFGRLPVYDTTRSEPTRLCYGANPSRFSVSSRPQGRDEAMWRVRSTGERLVPTKPGIVSWGERTHTRLMIAVILTETG